MNNSNVFITKQVNFCYGHKLPGYNGKCRQQHGHNSMATITVGGRDASCYPSMVMDFKKLSKILEPILEQLDHQDLTHFFDYCDQSDPNIRGEVHEEIVQVPATAETICRWMAKQIQANLPPGTWLVELQVSETPTSWATWKEQKHDNA